MTLLTMLISGDGEHVRWAGAGHDPPILFDPANATFTEPEGGGIPLGIMAEQAYEEYDLPFGGVGSVLVTATDGVWETASPSGELFGKARLKAVIQTHHGESADGLIQAIIVVLNEFRESDRPLDDVTIVVVKRRA
jgi:sigma-B regulation protein RsbU (phosphoserine phosphatase)